MTDAEKTQFYFSQLVLMFHAAAMQQMGKIKNPLLDKIERDLTAAQSSIDLLDMLKEKTKGNLSTDEDRLLTSILKELKLNFVDEKNKPSSEPDTKDQPEPKKNSSEGEGGSAQE